MDGVEWNNEFDRLCKELHYRKGLRNSDLANILGYKTSKVKNLRFGSQKFIETDISKLKFELYGQRELSEAKEYLINEAKDKILVKFWS